MGMPKRSRSKQGKKLDLIEVVESITKKATSENPPAEISYPARDYDFASSFSGSSLFAYMVRLIGNTNEGIAILREIECTNSRK